jgi:uncharacterized membrane-anchored protein YhcB (DUF1043 family)
LWLAVGLAMVVLAIVGLALILWRIGVSEHDEEMREDRRIERLLFRLIEGQQEMVKDQRETNRLLRQIVGELTPPPTHVADHFNIVSTKPR